MFEKLTSTYAHMCPFSYFLSHLKSSRLQKPPTKDHTAPSLEHSYTSATQQGTISCMLSPTSPVTSPHQTLWPSQGIKRVIRYLSFKPHAPIFYPRHALTSTDEVMFQFSPQQKETQTYSNHFPVHADSDRDLSLSYSIDFLFLRSLFEFSFLQLSKLLLRPLIAQQFSLPQIFYFFLFIAIIGALNMLIQKLRDQLQNISIPCPLTRQGAS